MELQRGHMATLLLVRSDAAWKGCCFYLLRSLETYRMWIVRCVLHLTSKCSYIKGHFHSICTQETHRKHIYYCTVYYS